jgi:hypothetical protein
MCNPVLLFLKRCIMLVIRQTLHTQLNKFSQTILWFPGFHFVDCTVQCRQGRLRGAKESGRQHDPGLKAGRRWGTEAGGGHKEEGARKLSRPSFIPPVVQRGKPLDYRRAADPWPRAVAHEDGAQYHLCC